MWTSLAKQYTEIHEEELQIIPSVASVSCHV